MAKVVFDATAGRGLLRRADVVVAVSQAEARDLPGDAVVLGSGVSALTGAAFGSGESPRDAGTGRLLFVGNGRPQKRASFLAGLLDRLPGATLQLVGPFSAGEKARFQRFGSRARFRDVLGDAALAEAYAQADLLLHPAAGEAFGLVPFEAALAGTAGIVAGGHGCAEWYGRAGGCVAPLDDLGPWVTAAELRLADPGLRRREASGVKAFAQAQLAWDSVAARLEEMYRR
jgi:glycosyltransferase involved in cell wall biosynthesis